MTDWNATNSCITPNEGGAGVSPLPERNGALPEKDFGSGPRTPPGHVSQRTVRLLLVEIVQPPVRRVSCQTIPCPGKDPGTGGGSSPRSRSPRDSSIQCTTSLTSVGLNRKLVRRVCGSGLEHARSAIRNSITSGTWLNRHCYRLRRFGSEHREAPSTFMTMRCRDPRIIGY